MGCFILEIFLMSFSPSVKKTATAYGNSRKGSTLSTKRIILLKKQTINCLYCYKKMMRLFSKDLLICYNHCSRHF